MKSWKTTALGALGAIGVYLQSQHEPAWLPVVGQVLAAFGVGGIGLFARDNDKSSEDVKTK